MASRFECSICISPFDDPRFLPCPGHHTFCRNCIEDYLKSTGNSTRPWTQFKCPNCRSKVVLPTDGVDGLTKNYYLEEPKSGYSPCKSHPKEDLRFYCSSCGEVICRDCKVVSHEGHKTETVEHITSELKSKIENVLDTANIDISVHEKQLQARIGGEQAEHKASLDFMKEYTVGLKAEIDRLLESLESLSKTRIDKGNRALTKVKEWIDGNHKSISQYKKSLTEGLNKKETDTRGAICDLNRLDKKLREIQNLTTPPDLHEDEDHNWSNRIDIEKIFLHISRRYNRALGELKEVVSMCKRQSHHHRPKEIDVRNQISFENKCRCRTYMRPTKINESFSELYDNEWTDAFDELQWRTRTGEKQIIQCLLTVLMEAYAYSNSSVAEEIEAREAEFSRIMTQLKEYGLSESDVIRGGPVSIKDHKMHLGGEPLSDLQQTFISNHLSDILRRYCDPVDLKYVSKYAMECVELTWWMNINEPPMALDEMKESTVFNKDVYRFYQSGGRTVDYYVWPALRLYKGGPLLSKGVAEGK